MCGIVCYLGQRPALPILLDGLKRLEYRGYDSSGLAYFENGSVRCLRSVGKIEELEAKVNGHSGASQGGIAHTRWATHGKPSETNAHPHGDCSGSLFVVHNGIIENYQKLKQELIERRHTFVSETDTEVLAHLVEEHFEGDLESAVVQALGRVVGTFGVAVVSRADPDKIVAARRGSPLILGLGNHEVFAASDVAALVRHTKKVVYLEDNEIAVLTPAGYRIRSLQAGPEIARSPQTVDWDVDAAEKQGFPHFMLKEIHEQPEVVESALRGRLLKAEGTSKLGGLEQIRDQLQAMRHLIIVSCGSSYYAGLLGRYIIEACTDISVEVDLASEFRYRKLNLREDTAILAISQSGETADTLAAIREADRKGALVMGLVNVVGSTIARETRAGIYNHAGPEIGVASTKAFTSQLTVLYLLTLLLARQQQFSVYEGQTYLSELESIPAKIRQILDRSEKIEAIARRYARFSNFLYLGRQFNYPIALEGALKLKEISYLHAEGYAAGEMKHGPIALIDRDFPSVCLAPSDGSFEKIVSNIQEIKARSGPVIAVGNHSHLYDLCDDVIEVPSTGELFSPLLNIIPLQLLAYYIAREKGCEIDQPRNLAKSVTVE